MDCKRCGTTEIRTILLDMDSVHYSKIVCAGCNTFLWWGKKPENEDKRSDKNATWRKRHKKAGYTCAVCGIGEDVLAHPSQWQVDHIKPLCDGGQDEFDNTMMLCVFCHTIKNSLQKKTKAMQGKGGSNG